MASVHDVAALADVGLQGDRHAKAGSSRQVLMIEKETLDLLGLAPGVVRENIATEGIALMELEPGSRIRLGTDVVVEVVQACAPCGRMDEIRPGLQRELAGRRGILCRVISGGRIAVGDPVSVI